MATPPEWSSRAAARASRSPAHRPRAAVGAASNGRTTRGAALRPPTYKGAALKALFGVVILFIFFKFLSSNNSTGQALTFCAVAFVMYTPVMYLTDKFIYNRKLKQQAARR